MNGWFCSVYSFSRALVDEDQEEHFSGIAKIRAMKCVLKSGQGQQIL